MTNTRYLLLIFFIFLIASSCKTKREVLTEYVYIEKNDSLRHLTSRIDSLMRLTMQRDSIHEKDSVSVVIKGDTVMIDRWHTVYKEHSYADAQKQKDIVHDTVFQTHTEYIDKYIEKEVIQEVNRLYWWQKTLMWIGGLGLLGIIGLIIFIIHKHKKLFQ